jgi:hypothetical protein
VTSAAASDVSGGEEATAVPVGSAWADVVVFLRAHSITPVFVSLIRRHHDAAATTDAAVPPTAEA